MFGYGKFIFLLDMLYRIFVQRSKFMCRIEVINEPEKSGLVRKDKV